MKVFDNFNMLKVVDEEMGNELLNNIDEGEWQDNSIFCFNDIEEFAEYELTEGWYAESGFNEDNYNGAPNPIDFIDLKAFGETLVDNWDTSAHYLTSDGKVLQTVYGW